ncbi:Asp-tRNA(Asn)/Glu-tRNA(Gln) amidotransferase subunit GatC [Pseudobacteriovorax antillogorgiicola]|uniref:Glutamyl-tRNA(Gln) amidotransferase subunit C n=1 Tax=Pseudobacteriovorax antillogorgiicola TaxID=1513793 RepID=A0A1Y6B984_9BACT|nr:Asp-tRNA(Asn)/Glu-tRNA(Gln) amidotransferase subunit GatC [Pseudobacteriovorax antillogorgiicola]TCS59142.1 aspartyl/glutamyl-tRNA(Asn/Gln) amidotransferase subunit C [Pseudobacteriovorax antillogorgiicola]SME91265.1 aspartyl/glutamyl-tRNA(Asn/Gln) amidotransferase subunit C [Pseudobacteriovorax antillogorgiicola]
MTQLDKETVLQVARLAKLALSDDEAEYYRHQLSLVTSYFSALDQAVDTLGDSWRSDIHKPETPERPDTVQTSGVLDDVLQSAPKAVGTAFQVPRIIE